MTQQKNEFILEGVHTVEINGERGITKLGDEKVGNKTRRKKRDKNVRKG